MNKLYMDVPYIMNMRNLKSERKIHILQRQMTLV